MCTTLTEDQKKKYAKKTLPEQERQEVLAHLKQCIDCSWEVAEIQATQATQTSNMAETW